MKPLLNNPYLLAAALLSALNLIFLVCFYWLFRRYQKKQDLLLAGEDTGKLPEIVARQKQVLASHNKNLRELGNILSELVDQNRLNLQKVGLVRFNPFADTGSNMSFSIALLNGKNNGIVISSLHGREDTRIYAKPVAAGESKHPLTEEEKQAIRQASQT